MVTVKYFLTEDGKIYFKNWIEKVHSESLKQEGFISLDSQCDEKGNPIASLRFLNENLLAAWSSTSQHDELVNDIEQYCIKPVDVESKLFI